MSWGEGKVISSVSPVDGKTIAGVTSTTTEEYEKIIQASVSAFKFWRNMPAPQRGEIVRQYGEKLREYKQLLESVAYEMGNLYKRV